MADEKYRTQLTGAQVDDALQQLNQRIAEGWAVGTRDGSPVGSGSEYYHNNAKYYAGISGQAVEDANAAAERAEAAVPAGTAGAVFFDRAQSLTDTQKEQARENVKAANNDTSVQVVTQTFTSAQQEIARANIAAGSTNPNHFHNPWFSVNQRGQSSYGASVYGVDRWFVTQNASVNVLSNGLELTTTNAKWGLEQRHTKDFIPYGTTLTFSALIDDGNLVQKSFVWNGQNINVYPDDYDIVGLEISVNVATYDRWYVCNKIASTHIIHAVKIEVGSVSTLLNDTPPDYYKELDRCKWYFQRIKAADSVCYFADGFSNASATYVNAKLNAHPMRAKPSLTKSGQIFVGQNAAGNDITAIGLNGGAYDAGIYSIFVAASCTANQPYRIVLAIGAYIDLSADL